MNSESQRILDHGRELIRKRRRQQDQKADAARLRNQFERKMQMASRFRNKGERQEFIRQFNEAQKSGKPADLDTTTSTTPATTPNTTPKQETDSAALTKVVQDTQGVGVIAAQRVVDKAFPESRQQYIEAVNRPPSALPYDGPNYMTLVEQVMREDKVNRFDAMAKVNRKYPAAREHYIRKANEGRR